MAGQGFPTTDTLLLDGLHDPEAQAEWSRFDQLYRHAITAFAQRLGLNSSDAEEAAQQTIIQFMRSFQANKYDRQRGKLRSWLMSIAKHRVEDIRRWRASRREIAGELAFTGMPDDETLRDIWNTEWRRSLVCQALTMLATTTAMDPRSIQIFEMVVLREQPPAAIAAELKITVQQVYLVKHRCLAKLRAIMRTLPGTEDWDAGDEINGHIATRLGVMSPA